MRRSRFSYWTPSPLLALAFLACLHPCAAQVSRPPAGARSSGAPWRVGLWEVGPIRYGMSVAEASAAVGDSLHVLAESSSPPCDSCIVPQGAPPGFFLSVYAGRIQRVDVIAPGIYTSDGIQVGSTIKDLKRLYGDALETTSGLRGQLEFWLWSNDVNRRRLIVFETDGQRIVSYRAGDRQIAQFEE